MPPAPPPRLPQLTRREYLTGYVRAVLADLIAAGQLRWSDPPRVMIARVMDEFRTQLAAEWSIVIAAAVQGVAVGALRATGIDKVYTDGKQVIEGLAELAKKFGYDPGASRPRQPPKR